MNLSIVDDSANLAELTMRKTRVVLNEIMNRYFLTDKPNTQMIEYEWGTLNVFMHILHDYALEAEKEAISLAGNIEKEYNAEHRNAHR